MHIRLIFDEGRKISSLDVDGSGATMLSVEAIGENVDHPEHPENATVEGFLVQLDDDVNDVHASFALPMLYFIELSKGVAKALRFARKVDEAKTAQADKAKEN